MLKRPSQAQAQPSADAVETPVVVVHPLIKLLEGGDVSPQKVVDTLNGSPFSRGAAAFAIKALETFGYVRDAAADKARGDQTVLLVNEGEAVRVTVKIKPISGERLGCYMDTIAKKEYRIKVRQYMTKPSTPDFDFHDKYNDGRPMPMRTMRGEILEETKGMYRMRLHGHPEPSCECLHCGRELRHPVSLLYGLGPICGEHFHINPLGSEEELTAAYESIRENMAAVTWTGWVIKKAVEKMEEVESEA